MLPLALLIACGRHAPSSDTESPAPPPRESATADTDRVEETGDTAQAPIDQRLTIDAGQLELNANGLTNTSLTVTATFNGDPAPDGTTIDLTSSLGRVALEPVEGGVATGVFYAGTWPGEAALTAEGWSVTGDDAIALLRGEPSSLQLHVHGSLSEGSAPMHWHAEQADLWGTDLLWWTDHDTSYYLGGHSEVHGFDFETGNLYASFPVYIDSSHNATWALASRTLTNHRSGVTEDAAHSGDWGWHLAGMGEGQMVYTVEATPDSHFKSLLGEVTLGFWIRPHGDPGLEIRIPLSASHASKSERDLEYNQIVLYHLSEPPEPVDGTHYVPIVAATGEWTQVTVDLSALALKAFPDLGLDQHAELVDVALLGAEGRAMSYDLDDFTFDMAVKGEALIARQREYVDQLPYQVRHLVGQEISSFGTEHLNAYGSEVPLIDYTSGAVTELAEAISHVHAHEGLVSFNHLFFTGSGLLPEDTIAELVSERIDELIETEGYGCDLLEVGYRERGGATEHFMAVWDAISAEGVWMTGIGTSDMHNEIDDFTSHDNTFVTWVAPSEEREEALLWELKRGAAWFGDPTAFPDGEVRVTLTIPSLQADMGQIVAGAPEEVNAEFSASWLAAGWLVYQVVDGARQGEGWVVGADGAFSISAPIDSADGAVVRFEVVDADGRQMLYSNPIYLLAPGDPLAEGIPVERIPAP